jgi:hypothetical protein
MTTYTLGFTGPGDISAASILPDHKFVVNYGIQITCNLWNLSCATSEAGSVVFYWVPLGWPTSGTPVPADDGTTGSNTAPAIGPGGALAIPEGDAYSAQITWVPTAAEIGLTGSDVRGAILVVSDSAGNAQCSAGSPSTLPDSPYTQVSGLITIWATDPGVRLASPPPVATGADSHGKPSTLVYVAFVFPNPTSKAADTKIVARSVGGGKPLPPVVASKKDGYEHRAAAKAIAGASTLVTSEVRVGFGDARARTNVRGFMGQMYTGAVDAAVADRLLDKQGLSLGQVSARLEPYEIRQGILEVAIPTQGSTTTTLVDVAYVGADGKRRGGFLLNGSSDGTIG